MKTFEEALELLSVAEEDADTPAGKMLEENVTDMGDTVFNSEAARGLARQMMMSFSLEPTFNPIKFSLAMLAVGVQIGMLMEKQEVGLPDVITHIN